MAHTIPASRFLRNRHPGICTEYAIEMTKNRSDFGSRLHIARKHAGLTQVQLAKDTGMSQSAIGEMELVGQGSAYTAQIARRCGVDPYWLATGEGEMVTKNVWPFPLLRPEQLSQLNAKQLGMVEKLALDLLDLPESSRPMPTKIADTNGPKAKGRPLVWRDTVERKRGSGTSAQVAHHPGKKRSG